MFDYPIHNVPREIEEKMEKAKYPKRKLRILNEWALSTFPERLEILKKAFESDGGVLDYTPESLMPIWDWAFEHTIKEMVSEEELDEKTANLGPLAKVIHKQLAKERFTEQSQTLLRDVGIYLGEVLKMKHPKFFWDMELKYKRSNNFGKVVLAGYTGEYNVDLQGVVVAIRWRDDEQGHDTERLYKIYIAQHEVACFE
ncbi:hypothetical protein HPT25_16740 [Bacillus sp. BRMEA1]|uniref:hypothetical protein n=1 Tax=Neobacillus endophyticus TaxID=2738405 RepID=UPI0015673A32|nr:hypothetical protein [Neobacillus endophyticus]NRD79011.1 hypothetical protein [Neobacillus endophyticus]